MNKDYSELPFILQYKAIDFLPQKKQNAFFRTDLLFAAIYFPRIKINVDEVKNNVDKDKIDVD